MLHSVVDQARQQGSWAAEHSVCCGLLCTLQSEQSLKRPWPSHSLLQVIRMEGTAPALCNQHTYRPCASQGTACQGDPFPLPAYGAADVAACENCLQPVPKFPGRHWVMMVFAVVAGMMVGVMGLTLHSPPQERWHLWSEGSTATRRYPERATDALPFSIALTDMPFSDELLTLHDREQIAEFLTHLQAPEWKLSYQGADGLVISWRKQDGHSAVIVKAVIPVQASAERIFHFITNDDTFAEVSFPSRPFPPSLSPLTLYPSNSDCVYGGDIQSISTDHCAPTLLPSPSGFLLALLLS